MQADLETITLQVKDYISPECTCKVEDMVNRLPHVVDSSFDQVNNIFIVKIHKGMSSAEVIKKEPKCCKIPCAHHKTPHEMEQMKNKTEAQKRTRKCALLLVLASIVILYGGFPFIEEPQTRLDYVHSI